MQFHVLSQRHPRFEWRRIRRTLRTSERSPRFARMALLDVLPQFGDLRIRPIAQLALERPLVGVRSPMVLAQRERRRILRLTDAADVRPLNGRMHFRVRLPGAASVERLPTDLAMVRLMNAPVFAQRSRIRATLVAHHAYGGQVALPFDQTLGAMADADVRLQRRPIRVRFFAHRTHDSAVGGHRRPGDLRASVVDGRHTHPNDLLGGQFAILVLEHVSLQTNVVGEHETAQLTDERSSLAGGLLSVFELVLSQTAAIGVRLRTLGAYVRLALGILQMVAEMLAKIRSRARMVWLHLAFNWFSTRHG